MCLRACDGGWVSAAWQRSDSELGAENRLALCSAPCPSSRCVSLSLCLFYSFCLSLSLFKSGWAGSVTYREEREGVCEQTSEEYRLQKLALFLSFTLSLIILDKKGAKLSSSC